MLGLTVAGVAGRLFGSASGVLRSGGGLAVVCVSTPSIEIPYLDYAVLGLGGLLFFVLLLCVTVVSTNLVCDWLGMARQQGHLVNHKWS